MECPVCMEMYRTPLLLPGCGHTLCSFCAYKLVTEDNFLQCPECRLIYQLRRGVASLPKNIALQRTIDEQRQRAASEPSATNTCQDHPGDSTSLFCRTCERSICLKCYFASSNRRGEQTLHADHQVEPREDVQAREWRLFEENLNVCLEEKCKEAEYIAGLTEASQELEKILAEKSREIDQNRDNYIAHVKKTAGKLKFVLKGTVARDLDVLRKSLESSRKREDHLGGLIDSTQILQVSPRGSVDITILKEARTKLEVLPSWSEGHRAQRAELLAVRGFDTALESCLADPRHALAYQSEPPREPKIAEQDCLISNTQALIAIHYNQAVRTQKLVISYKEAMYKGFSVKQWKSVEITDFSCGKAQCILKGLEPGTMYRIIVKAENRYGESPACREMWFRTLTGDVEIRVT